MNRRGFLGLLLAAAPAMVLDPERLLWVPGQRTFFLPSEVVTAHAVAFDFASVDLKVSLDQFAMRILNPAIARIAFGGQMAPRYAQHEGRICA